MRINYGFIMLYCVVSSALLAYIVVYALNINPIEQLMFLIGGATINGIVMSLMSGKEKV